MRGALEPIPGVSVVDVLPGRTTVWVAVEPQVEPAQLLTALAKAGEKATLVPAGESRAR